MTLVDVFLVRHLHYKWPNVHVQDLLKLISFQQPIIDAIFNNAQMDVFSSSSGPLLSH